MKTRIVKTKFWDDPKTLKLHPDARSLFIYLLTNRFVGLTSYYELDDGQMLLHLGWDKKRLEKAKLELSKHGRAFFYAGWVFIPNLDKHNPYWKSPKTKVAYEEELRSVPQHIKDEFNRQLDSSMIVLSRYYDSSMIVPLKHKKENINNKSTTNKQSKTTRVVNKAYLILKIYNLVFDKKLKSTKGFESNLEYWLDTYDLRDIANAIISGWADDWWRARLTPIILFRRKNPKGEPVDWIGTLIAKQKENTSSLSDGELDIIKKKALQVKKLLQEAQNGPKEKKNS